MNIQYSGWESILLSNFSSALSTNAQTHYTLFAVVDIEYMAFSDWQATNTYASGTEYSTGYQYTLTGNHFIDDTPLLTIKTISLTSLSSNENFILSSPGVTANYNNGSITGAINKFEYTNFTTGESYSISGSFGVSADGAVLKAGTITSLIYSSNSVDSYSIKGSLTTNSNGEISGGTLNEITFIDSSEHTLKASGFSISWTQFVSLTSGHSSLSDLFSYINSESNLAGNDYIQGGDEADNLYSGAGNDTLDGGAGADTLIGGKGNDTYIVDDEDDEIIENFNEGTDLVKASVSYTLSDNVENLTLTDGSANGGTAAINGIGNALANTITGNAGNNILDGGAGVDKLIGGNGDDTYIVDLVRTGTTPANFKVALQDTITETALAGSGTDTVILRGTFTEPTTFTTLTLGANLENLNASDTGLTKLNLTGNVLANTLTGNDTNNILDGGAGVDTLIGGLGDDTYVIDIKTSAGSILIEDTVTELNGTTEGIDTVKLRGTATLATAATLTLDNDWANIEILDASATGSTKLDLTGNNLGNTLIGNAAANILTGGTGDDILNGGAGADTMIGGDGDDTYIVDNIADIVTEDSNEGTDLVKASVSYTLGDNVENLELTGTAAINGTGNDDANIITGNAGNNILDGKGGIDTLIGGKGNDTYIVDDKDDEVIEAANEGIDLVKASVDYELTDFVENLTLTGNDHINGTGNALANIITGNAGNNILDGGAGVDKLIGGNGDDTYIVDLVRTGTTPANFKVALQDTITETALAGSGTDTVILRGTFTEPTTFTTLTLGANLENLNASDTGLTKLNLTGNALANTLTGNDTNNILDGGAGVDTLIGGLGDDTYVIDIKTSAGSILIEDTVTELNGTTEGIDTVKLRGTATLATAATLTLDNDWANIEILDASATGSTKLDLTGNNLGNTLIGNAAANILTGGTGDDILNGGAGIDTMIGGEGNDIYIVDNIADQVIENDNEGIDWVKTSVSYTLSNYVEFLELTGTSAINGTGNDLNNFIKGNTSNNILNGGIGGDIMIGGKGNDTYIVDDEDDEVIEAANEGIDLVKASVDYELTDFVENLTLTGNDHINGTGNALANTITGNAGNNILDGGTGVDKLIGGNGNDIYIVDLIKTGSTLANYKVALQDTITETAAVDSGTDIVKLRLLDDVVYNMNNATTLTLGANLERLDASGTESIKLNLTGNALANTLTGNDADNILDGGAGVDTLQGGEGNDIYILDLKATAGILSIEDTVEEFNGTTDGIDTIKLRGSVTLTEATTLSLDGSAAITWSHVENIDASATKSTKLNLTGNEFDNTLTGNAAANILDGGMGNDTLNGGAGNDTLIGGLGNDTLTGGLGADVFKWTTSDLVAPGDISNNTDTITDFSIAQKDQLDLRDILTGASNLESYLDIVFENGSTHIRISSTGEFADGTYDSTKEDAHIVLSNINLFTATKTAAGNDAQLIGYLTQNNYLLID